MTTCSTEIRSKFSQRLSNMYREEVPKYGLLIDIVKQVNKKIAVKNPKLLSSLGLSLERVIDERHGAIRLGTGEELRTIADIFEIMGMSPCNYYDLTVAGHPIHATAFRPIDKVSLAKNPFRVFTSLLRKDLLPKEIQPIAEEILSKRKIFSNRLLDLIKIAKEKKGLSSGESEDFIEESLKIFRWNKEANISKELYDKLMKFSPIAADIVGFKGPHINHLTPVALDIEEAFKEMKANGLVTIENIQGPPLRDISILLRQTSFKAIEEETIFYDENQKASLAKHRARFGEIESRGAALTPKGRALYDKLLLQVIDNSKNQGAENYAKTLSKVFQDFPDSINELIDNDLVYCNYTINKDNSLEQLPSVLELGDIKKLLAKGAVSANLIVYEDFLPVSAARIFDSNLDSQSGRINLTFKSLEEYKDYEHKMKLVFEKELGRNVVDSFSSYGKEQEDSIKTCIAGLNKTAR